MKPTSPGPTKCCIGKQVTVFIISTLIHSFESMFGGFPRCVFVAYHVLILVAFVMLVTDMARRNLDFAPRHFAALEILRCLVLVTCKAACVKLSRECYKMPTVSRSKTQFHNTSSIFIQFQTDLRSYKFPQGSIFLCFLACTLIPVLLLPALLAKRPATQHKDERHEKRLRACCFFKKCLLSLSKGSVLNGSEAMEV